MQSCERLLELLNQSEILVAEAEEYFRIPYPSEVFRGFQGGCSDGSRYYYQVLMHYVLEDRSKDFSCIAKVDLLSRTVVKYSDVLHMDHANDITYHPTRHLLMVTNNAPNPTRVTLVDPDTLALIKDIGIPKGSGAIAYCASKDLYAISQGGSTLHILDGNFKWVASYSRTDKTGYTAQGMGCDDDYVYFPMSGSKDNVLVIYDWSGNYVATVNVPMSQESESMFWVNGKYYIAYNASGEAVYETTFEIIFE
jgi:hypothetical protein